jgi:hypothetical protein
MAQKFQRTFYFLRIKIILEAINQGTGTFWGEKYWVLVPYTGVVHQHFLQPVHLSLMENGNKKN